MATPLATAVLGRTNLEVTRLSFGAMEVRGSRIWGGRPVTDDQAKTILNAVLDAGAEEVNDHGGSIEIISDSKDVVAVRQALQAAGIDYESAESTFVPNMTVPVDADTVRKVFTLIEALEDVDDVQNVFTNIDISDEVLAELSD